MTAMWGDAARQIQVLLALLVSAPVLGELLAVASVRVRPMLDAAQIQRGRVAVTAQVLTAAGGPLLMHEAPDEELARATRLRIDDVRVLAHVGGPQ